jgi:hypothetical protein
MAHTHDHSRAPASALWDSSAVGLSGLCLAHCLALPVVAAALPSLGAWLHAEWVHVLFLLVALPLSVVALWRKPDSVKDVTIMVLAAVGLALLAAGAFPARWPNFDEQLTVMGSVALVTAHVWNRWIRYCAVQPPSTGNRAPLTEAPASDAR